jgi:hypothetical protein
MRAYIFGAGASKYAGYPLASQLRQELSAWLDRSDSSVHWVPRARNRMVQVRETFGSLDDFEGILGKLEEYGYQRVRPTGPTTYSQDAKDILHDCMERMQGSLGEPFATLSIVRGYRHRGTCGDDAAPLLKPIIAKPGDVVEVSSLGLSVNGTLLPNTAPLATDTKGRPLEGWPSGRYVVAPETVMGRIPLSSLQLRQSLLWPSFDHGNSASLEGVTDTMNARFLDRLSLCSAIGIGLGVSTRHPGGHHRGGGNATRVLHPRHAQGCV